MTKFNKFARGSGCYTCNSCDRRTRATGDGAQLGLCEDCFEIAGYDNSVSDGHYSNEKAIEILQSAINSIAAKGGNVQKVKDGCFAIQWPAEEAEAA